MVFGVPLGVGSALFLLSVNVCHYTFAPVFTDQTMRQLTGEDPARELLRLWPDLPILLCAGFSPSLTEEMATARGIRALLMIPIGRRDLCLAVQQLLAKRAARSVRPGARQFTAV